MSVQNKVRTRGASEDMRRVLYHFTYIFIYLGRYIQMYIMTTVKSENYRQKREIMYKKYKMGVLKTLGSI